MAAGETSVPRNEGQLLKAARPAFIAPRARLAYTVQLGAFSSRENAALAHDFWKRKGYDIYVSESRDAGNHPVFVVRSGVFERKRDAMAAARAIRGKDDGPAVSVPTQVGPDGKPATLDLDRTAHAPLPPAGEPSASPAAAPPLAIDYALQLGAFSTADHAAAAARFWHGKGYDTRQVEIRDGGGRLWHAVRAGTYPDRKAAATVAQAFARKEDALALVTPNWAEHQSTAPASAAKPVPALLAYSVQLGVFASAENASRALSALLAKGVEAYVAPLRDRHRQRRYAVRAGHFTRRDDGLAMMRGLAGKQRGSAILVALRGDASVPAAPTRSAVLAAQSARGTRARPGSSVQAARAPETSRKTIVAGRGRSPSRPSAP